MKMVITAVPERVGYIAYLQEKLPNAWSEYNEFLKLNETLKEYEGTRAEEFKRHAAFLRDQDTFLKENEDQYKEKPKGKTGFQMDYRVNLGDD